MILIFDFHTLTDMASNHAPLTATEKHQLRTQPNVDLILAWAMVRGIDLGHPEVLEQMRMKGKEVSENTIWIKILFNIPGVVDINIKY